VNPGLQNPDAGESKDSSGNVIEHDACAFGQALKPADGPWLEDVEQPKQD
jgi:hypothetical protein